MSFAQRFENTFKKLLPSPFSIAIGLTAITFLLAYIFTKPAAAGGANYFGQLIGFWATGLWDGPLLIFAMQMMLILVLGHILALSPPAITFINFLTISLNSTAKAASAVAFFTMLVALFNWGLGLIFGAIFARKIAESAQKNGYEINYPIVGAAGYIGLMVWHGGLSGSAPIKANDTGHIKEVMSSANSQLSLANLPDLVPLESTIFSPMNAVTTLLLLTIIPLVHYFIGKKSTPTTLSFSQDVAVTNNTEKPIGAEKIDASKWVGRIVGLMLLGYAVAEATVNNSAQNLNFITPNYLNTKLLGLGLLLHASIKNFTQATDKAIGDAAGILIQFPLYFGIMAIMRDSGLVLLVAEFFTQIATPQTFPIFTFISSGIINIFVPSGGGQWSVQAPILIEASQQLGVPLSKSIMAMAYGDQLTNMLQPFWALPLLGITGLKAKEILPYTLLIMVVGFCIFISMLLLF